MKDLVIKKCTKCGATVQVLEDCKCQNCGIKCCGTEMQKIEANIVDASIEKHKPRVEVVGTYIVAQVDHVMEEEHFIEWIMLNGEKVSARKYFKTGEVAKAVFPYIKGSIVYAYCNKHGLWSTIVE